LIQTESSFVPLLELHDAQHLAMFSRVMILASLMMCSHVAMDFRDPSAAGDSNIGIRQYAHFLSRCRTSVSSHPGMPHPFI